MNRSPHLAIVIVCMLVAASSFAYAQKPITTGSLEYRLVSTTKIDTFEKELNTLAEQGFRVEITAQSMRASSLTVLVARPKVVNQSQKYEYRLVNPKEFKKQKDELEKSGFTCRGSLMATALFGLGAPPLLLFERQSASAAVAQFDLVESKKEKELEQKINISASNGYSPKTISITNSLLQRDTNSTQKREYCLLNTYRMSTLEKELNQAAQEGFHFVLSGALNSVLLARDPGSKDASHFEYEIVSLEESEKSLSLLNATAEKQFRFVGVTQLGLATIFERQAGAVSAGNRIEFKVLETRSSTTLEKEFDEALAAGFSPLSFGHGAKGYYSIFLSRETATTQKD